LVFLHSDIFDAQIIRKDAHLSPDAFILPPAHPSFAQLYLRSTSVFHYLLPSAYFRPSFRQHIRRSAAPHLYYYPRCLVPLRLP